MVSCVGGLGLLDSPPEYNRDREGCLEGKLNEKAHDGNPLSHLRHKRNRHHTSTEGLSEMQECLRSQTPW